MNATLHEGSVDWLTTGARADL